MTTTASTTIVTNEIATRHADSQTILHQIAGMDLMACGARDFVGLPDGLMFSVSRQRRKLVIKLQLNDLYVVERVRMGRNLIPVSEAVETDVHAEELSATCVRLGDV